MIVQVSYETAHGAFCTVGLDAPSKVGRIGKPLSSNFTEIKAALSVLAANVRMRRFRSWADISKPGIVKVRCNHKRDWHWVYASRDAVYGLHVLDPARQDVYLERFPPGMSGIPLDVHDPHGSFLELTCTLNAERHNACSQGPRARSPSATPRGGALEGRNEAFGGSGAGVE